MSHHQGHTGRPTTERWGGRIRVLCPHRHLYASIAERDWAGSRLEMHLGDSTFTVTCTGQIHSQEAAP